MRIERESPFYKIGQSAYEISAAIHGWDSEIVSDARFIRHVTVKQIHFVKRLAVFGDETDRHEHKLRHAFARKLSYRFIRRGRQPLYGTDLALKRKRVRAVISNLAHDKLDGPFRMIEIWVALPDVADWNAVRAEDYVRA